TVDDTRYSNLNGTESTHSIVAAEAYLDTPPWAENALAPLLLTATDGAFDETSEAVSVAIATGELAPGRHLIYVRAQDSSGDWGPFSGASLWLYDPATAPTIQGRVRSSGSGTPVAATVTVGAFSIAGDPTSGVYSLRVPEGTYDLAAAAPAHRAATVAAVVAPALATITQDFLLQPHTIHLVDSGEGASPGWTAQSPWALTTEAAASPVHSWTESPGGLYGNNVDSALTSPVLDLAGTTGVDLFFRHVYDLEGGYDYGLVEISTNAGGTWTEVVRYEGLSSDAWRPVDLPLPALDGAPQARIRFRLTTDEGVVKDGWHVDDIELRSLAPHPLFADAFESGGTTHWSALAP
ncbi:MAG: immune inhibitor A, partial [Thermoanaerobaculia bacterium]|nr:immune inhibitor A [Thermoanaerobaculia bacterium]